MKICVPDQTCKKRLKILRRPLTLTEISDICQRELEEIRRARREERERQRHGGGVQVSHRGLRDQCANVGLNRYFRACKKQ